jgi:cytochrome b pre-mRNA-processing protein 3
MARGFYGRIRAYEDGLAGEDRVLAAALARNLFGTAKGALPLAAATAYVRRAAAQLGVQPAAELLAGHVVFTIPESLSMGERTAAATTLGGER